MDEESFESFVEEFNTQYDTYMDNARKIIESKTPDRELRSLRDAVHNIASSCSFLNIENLREFFTALETVISNTNKRQAGKRRISPLLDKALGIGFFKFQSVAKILDKGFPEAVEDLLKIEIIVDVENLYSIAGSQDL